MYIPATNAEDNPAVLFDFIASHPFGTLITASSVGLFATHLPVIVDRTRGPHGVIEAHVARANPHHARASTTDEALLVFLGPDAYITPSWYAAKREHGKVVPTWNYAAVHVYGTLRFVEDAAFFERHLRQLTEQQEHRRDEPWAVSDAPSDFVAQMTKAIVGVEVVITRMEGKWKMSQNRSAVDVDGVVRGLAASEDPRERAVGEIVRQRAGDR